MEIKSEEDEEEARAKDSRGDGYKASHRVAI